MKSVTIHHGDSRAVLKSIPDNSIDSAVMDPPYAFVSIVKRFGGAGAAEAKSNGATGVYQRASAGFMGHAWDTGETAFDPGFWADVLRVLKPGGHVLAFGAGRTVHQLAMAIENADFEVRDRIVELIACDTHVANFMNSLTEEQQGQFLRCVEDSRFGGELAWVFGSGFPKSHNVNPLSIVETGETFDGWGTALKPAIEPIIMARKPLAGTVLDGVLSHGCGAINIDACRIGDGEDRASGGPPNKRGSQSIGGGWANDRERAQGGRWPANLIHDGSDDVVCGFPDAPGQQGRVSGNEPTANGFSGAVAYSGMLGRIASSEPRSDTGSAARFFYSAKADADDRMGSKHPTVKPIDLMRYLVRLVTPPGGVVLDPFAGSGSTGVAAMLEGFDSILIEREAEYVADIERKVAFYRGEGRLAAQEKSKVRQDDHDDLPLFGGASGPLFADKTGKAA